MRFSKVALLAFATTLATAAFGHQYYAEGDVSSEGEKKGGEKKGKKGGKKDGEKKGGEKSGETDHYYEHYHEPDYKPYYEPYYKEECKCDGVEYFLLADFTTSDDVHIQWAQAYLSTPPNCVLAPVRDMDDIAGISGTARSKNAWLGVYKPLSQVSNTVDDAPISGWKNLDGSSVPAVQSLWASGEPNNDPPKQNYAHWYGTRTNGNAFPPEDWGLRDLQNLGNSGPRVTSAVYLCCATNALDYCNSNSTVTDFPYGTFVVG